MIPPEVTRLVDALPEHFAVTQENGRGRCIEATRLATAVLRAARVPCRPMACDVVALNAEALALYDQGHAVASWPATAWSRGTFCESSHPGPNLSEPYRRANFGGHLVVASPIDDDWFVDLTVEQYHDGDHGIVIEAAFAGDGVNWTDGGARWALPGGGAVDWYWRPERKAWRTSPAWRQDVRNELVALMVPILKGG